MQINSEDDFPMLRQQFAVWRKRFPMFTHDVHNIERVIENFIERYSNHLVLYRQTKRKSHLEAAQKEIENINQALSIVEKLELMAMLSRG